MNLMNKTQLPTPTISHQSFEQTTPSGEQASKSPQINTRRHTHTHRAEMRNPMPLQ